MAIAEISIVPLGIRQVGVSEYVADAIRELQRSGLSYQLTPMGTIIEGPIDQVLSVIGRMHETPFRKGVQRVYTTIKLDDRRDREVRMNEKVQSVEEKIRA